MACHVAAPFIVAAALLVLGVAVWAFWLTPEISVLEKDKIIGRGAVVPATGD